MDRLEKRPKAYTALSKHYFFAKMMVSAYTLKSGMIPLNPFNNFDYFMNDMVDRDLTVRANNNLIMLSDEVWTFGPISDGMFAEIKLAHSLGIPVRHFSAGKRMADIREINAEELVFECELVEDIGEDEIWKEILSCRPADGECRQKNASKSVQKTMKPLHLRTKN